MRKLITGAAAATTLGTTLLLAQTSAGAEDTVTLRENTGALDIADTRSAGHVDFEAHSLHVWTEGATSEDKAAGYFAVDKQLADIGEPCMVWRFNDASLPAVPGQQIVFDADDVEDNGNNYNVWSASRCTATSGG